MIKNSSSLSSVSLHKLPLSLAITHAVAFVFVVIAAAARWRVVVNRGFADVYGGARRSVYGYGFVDGSLRLDGQVYFGIAPERGFAVCAGG